ncbi:TPR-like protein [Corynespora cassiicola Philippines]|uniref:TPR-like protein n=1 Tax=Corynespora cassiicola Philippines TaxID=1448308 RepID=A0A2T2N0Q1_CORCC|nr:TPR-like protein [Corynespora cassiicola Philippines]
MLPAVAPNARVMRYGYESQWFGKEAMQQSASTVADRLLKALKRKRKDVSFRPLLFVAHCFGGLVVLKALLEAEQYPSEWPGVFPSTTGLVFFGTPFRGAGGMNQMEMLEAARREYDDDQVQPTALEVLQPGNAYLQEVVDGFLKKMRGQTTKTQIACFYELKASDVGKIVGGQSRTRFVVSESSGCLDLSDATSKHSLSRTHFNMNKFGKATEEDFETVAEVVVGMVKGSPKLVWARSQYHGKHKIDFHLQGMPIVGKFVQRDAETQELERLLVDKTHATARQKVVVLHGLGGIGKTQLSVEFARRHHHAFSSVFWLDGSSEASLKQSFAGMAQRLPQRELTADGVEMLKHSAIDVDVAVRECLRWLSLPSNQDWLLIFDNIDRDFHDKDDSQAYNVKAYFPHADHGSILMTSRLANLQRQGSGVRVGTVDTEQARAILENSAGRMVKDADVILQRLSGLPLALTQAGSYMQQTNVSASAYTKHYDETWERLMQKQGRFPLEEYGDRNVLTTWTISYEQVRKQSEEAAWMLKLWGFLDHGEIWYELVAAGCKLSNEMDVPAWLLTIATDELEYTDAVGLLSRYSLADARESSNSYSMHSVLHRWCGRLAEGGERYELGRIAAGIVASNVPNESESEFWTKRKRLLAHAVSVSWWIMGVDSSKEESRLDASQSRMYYSLGYLLAGEDRLKEAEAMYNRALQGYEETLGPKHTSTLDTVNNLGLLYTNQGRLDKAEAMYNRALRGYEEALGPKHISTLDTVHNLGLLYTNQERLDEAETMYNRALQGYEEALGPKHTSTLLTVNNLGGLYRDQERLEEAETMLNRALQGREEALGPKHISTLQTVNNLGLLYADQGQLDEAETMYNRALRGREEALGPKHTSTLLTVNNLGSLYRDQERLDKAEAMYNRSLQGKEEALGPKHTSTLQTVNSLGLLYADQGRLDKAETMYDRALQGYQEALGPKHTSTLYTVNNLGLLYAEQGRLDKAETMYNRALQGYEEALGPNHTSTLQTVNNSGILYMSQGRLDKAEVMYNRALQGYEEALGPKHTSTLSTVNNLGNLYTNQGQLDKAEAMYNRALRGFKEALGPKHTSTLGTVNNLGLLYAEQGRLDKAETMYDRALRGFKKALGLKHTLTLETVNNLGVLYKDQGQLDKAKTMYDRALQGREEALGPKHTSTLETVNNLGFLYVDQGRLDNAEAMYNRTLQGYQEAIKPEHLSTYLPALNTMWGLAALFDHQHRIEDAKLWYSKALVGYKMVKGTDHPMCQRLRNKLDALRTEYRDSKPVSEKSPQQESSTADSSANIDAGRGKSVLKQQRLLGKRKRDQEYAS